MGSTCPPSSQSPDRKALVDKLLEATAPSTQIALRTPYYKYTLFNRRTTLTSDEAYSGSSVSRVGKRVPCPHPMSFS